MILTVCANPSVDSFWLVDHIDKGTANRSEEELFFPGGKGIHVAYAIKELGSDVVTLCIWGGQTGKWLKDQCLENDIETIGPFINQWTRLCITTKSSTDWNETELLGAGPKLSKSEVDSFLTSYKNFLQTENPDAVVISGSVPKGFPDDTYQKMISKAQRFSVPAYLDASGPLLQHALKANPFAVHINEYEGKALCHFDEPRKIAQWLQQYCDVAAVTAGAKGLFLSVDENLYHSYCKLDQSQITSTVGSGDCLLAGLSLATLKNKNHEYWAKFATACATANCVNPQLGMLDAEDVNSFLSKITLETL